jgi:uncharacterized protein
VSPEIESLLALQSDDAVLDALEKRLRAFEPRERDLDRVRQVAEDALSRARAALEAEERRHGAMDVRVQEHRQLHARNVAQLERVQKLRDASAATSQVEQARQMLAAEENELDTIGRRRTELRNTVETQESALRALEEEQRDARAQLAEERAAVQRELDAARAKRDGAAQGINRTLLSKYDRIRGRRKGQGEVVYPLRGPSCGNCDTAIPLQRRTVMQRTQAIEMCEACGVLLYAAE